VKKTLLTVAGIVVGLWVLNFLSGIFAFNFAASRQERANYFMEGVGRATELRARVDQFFRQSNRFPDSNQELGVGAPETYRLGVVDRVTVGPAGAVQVDYSKSKFDGGSVIMRPLVNLSGTGPSVRWECFAIGVDDSVAALIHEPTCATVRNRAAIPAPPAANATVDHLISAIYARKKSLVQYWIATGINVDAVGEGRLTPLSVAIERGNSEILAMVVAAGANVNRKLENGTAPLITATKQGCSPNVIRILTDAGAEIEARDEKGMTALMHAANVDNAVCVNALLRAGADIDATDNSGSKAINFAARFGERSRAYAALSNHNMKLQQGDDFVYRLPDSN